MKLTTRESEKYHRPVMTRFSPDWLDKKAVTTGWVDSDRIARVEIESGCWLYVHRSYADRHGYPTA